MKLWAILLALAGLAPLATAEPPTRVVSGSGSLTEVVYALGAEDRLVAVDTTSVHPESALALPKIGYARALSAEGILSMKPDLLLLTDEAGPTAVVDQLRAAEVPMVEVAEDHSPDSARKKIMKISEALQLEKDGEAILSDFDARLNEAAALVKEVPRDRAIFLFAAGGGSPLAAGGNTGGEAMLALAGMENAMEGYEGYKPVSAEAVVAANPAWIVTTTRTVEGIGGIEALLDQPGLSVTEAARESRVIVVDDAMLLNFGPRLPEAIEALVRPRLQDS